MTRNVTICTAFCSYLFDLSHFLLVLKRLVSTVRFCPSAPLHSLLIGVAYRLDNPNTFQHHILEQNPFSKTGPERFCLTVTMPQLRYQGRMTQRNYDRRCGVGVADADYQGEVRVIEAMLSTFSTSGYRPIPLGSPLRTNGPSMTACSAFLHGWSEAALRRTSSS